MNVFLDTNVVIDLLGERKPYFDDVAYIVEMHKKKLINASVSTLTIVNCAYILRKAYSEKVMLEKVKKLCDTFEVTAVDRAAIMQSIKNGGHDFEDAVQYFSSLQSKPDVIITRDKQGFENFGIKVMTPSEFIAESRK